MFCIYLQFNIFYLTDMDSHQDFRESLVLSLNRDLLQCCFVIVSLIIKSVK